MPNRAAREKWNVFFSFPFFSPEWDLDKSIYF